MQLRRYLIAITVTELSLGAGAVLSWVWIDVRLHNLMVLSLFLGGFFAAICARWLAASKSAFLEALCATVLSYLLFSLPIILLVGGIPGNWEALGKILGLVGLTGLAAWRVLLTALLLRWISEKALRKWIL